MVRFVEKRLALFGLNPMDDRETIIVECVAHALDTLDSAVMGSVEAVLGPIAKALQAKGVPTRPGPPPHPPGCQWSPIVSRTCERGTAGCSVVHGRAV
jgi:hypothetical protein